MPILGTAELEDLEDLRFVAGEGPPVLAAVALDESLVVLEIMEKGGRVLARVR